MISVVRLNFVQPTVDPAELSRRYQAGVEMTKYADEHGFLAVSFEEHHGADNGWSPSPLINAALVAGCTKRIRITISAVLVPLHDPLRLAEDIAVLDLASGGRVGVIAGIGYRRSEYAAHGKDWDGRGRLMDECIEAMVNAWTGEPFEYQGRTVKVTPKPNSPAMALLFVGGRTKAAARRAARFGLGFAPVAHLPELEAYYTEQCAAFGTHGFVIAPSGDTTFLHVSEDPDRDWAELGHHFLHEAMTYAGWQTDEQHSAAYSGATTVEELRAEGKYVILTPEEVVERSRQRGPHSSWVLHPLCGGLPIERGWQSLQLYVDKVLPAVTG